MAAIVAVVSTVQTSVFLRFSSALDTGGSGRTSIWAVALEAAKHRILQGYGLGNFTQAFNLYYLKIHQPYPFGWDSPAHNLVLHYLVELGVIGLALIGAFIAIQFLGLRAIDRNNELYDYRIVMEASLVAIVVVSLRDRSLPVQIRVAHLRDGCAGTQRRGRRTGSPDETSDAVAAAVARP